MEINRRNGIYFIHDEPVNPDEGLARECMDGDLVLADKVEGGLRVTEIIQRKHSSFPTLLRYNPQMCCYESPLYPLYRPTMPQYPSPPQRLLVFPQSRLSAERAEYPSVVYSWNSHQYARNACLLWNSTIRLSPSIDVNSEFWATRVAMTKLRNEALDLSALTGTFTIDPPGCDDADDALTVDFEGRKIYVHVTLLHDLSRIEYDRHLVRGFTLYLPGREDTTDAHHLLKDRRHSLVKGKKRLTLTTCFEFTEDGEVGLANTFSAWIEVKESYTYDNPPSVIKDSWVGMIIDRYRKPVLSLPVLDLSMNDDLSRLSVHRLKYHNSLSHTFISTLMILTNVNMCKILDTRIPRRLHMLDRIIEDTETFNNLTVVEKILKLKTYRKASYSSSTEGHHWALRELSYTHSTSPLRRHFDVLVHRSVCSTHPIDENLLVYLNDREVVIRFLGNCYRKWKISEYLKGEKLEVVVTVTFPGGCYWYSPEWAVEGKSILNWEKGPKVSQRIMVYVDDDC